MNIRVFRDFAPIGRTFRILSKDGRGIVRSRGVDIKRGVWLRAQKGDHHIQM